MSVISFRPLAFKGGLRNLVFIALTPQGVAVDKAVLIIFFQVAEL